MLIPPLIFWACGDGSVVSDAGVAAPDAMGFADASTFADASNADAEEGADVDSDAGVEADAETHPDASAGCTYPEGAVEPMMLNRVLSPYSWPEALNGAGENKDINLTQIYCDNDPDLAWGDKGHLLFVSIPAW